MASPDSNSKRSAKRKVRNFRGLEFSRIHKRADNRLAQSQTFQGKRHPAGAQVSLGQKCFVTAGGALRYH